MATAAAVAESAPALAALVGYATSFAPLHDDVVCLKARLVTGTPRHVRRQAFNSYFYFLLLDNTGSLLFPPAVVCVWVTPRLLGATSAHGKIHSSLLTAREWCERFRTVLTELRPLANVPNGKKLAVFLLVLSTAGLGVGADTRCTCLQILINRLWTAIAELAAVKRRVTDATALYDDVELKLSAAVAEIDRLPEVAETQDAQVRIDANCSRHTDSCTSGLLRLFF